jgi:hypothetical protein
MAHDEIRDVVNSFYRAGYRFVLAREVIREIDVGLTEAEVGQVLDSLLPESAREEMQWQVDSVGAVITTSFWTLAGEIPESSR